MFCRLSSISYIVSSMSYVNHLALRLVFLDLHLLVSIFLLTEAESCDSHSLGMFSVSSSCGCEGDTLIYSCTVFGGVSTVWQGSAFGNCGITLLHSHFASGRRSTGTCNHGYGRITGQSECYSINYSTNTSYYTSYVRVTATSNLNNTDIQCLHRIDSQLMPIGSYNISIISEYSLPLVPLTDVYVSQVNSSYISFTWTPSLLHCQPFAYFVYAYNCGECPNLVTDHTMTCMYVEADGRMCSFHIQRRACNITGKNSSTFSILLTHFTAIPATCMVSMQGVADSLAWPEPPNVTITSHYYTNNLIQLEVQISSDSVSQEPLRRTTHTIDYVDAKSGYKCTSSTIKVSSCHGSKCVSIFKLPSSSCSGSSELNVSAFSNNSFGAGKASQPITIYRSNRFLNVTFNSLSGTLFCSFLEEHNYSSCHLEYGICNNQSVTRLTLGNNLSGTIQISEPTHYCYSASATDVDNTIVVHGEFYSGKTLKLDDSQEVNCNILLTIIYTLASTVVVSLIAVILVVTVSCIYVRLRPRNNPIREFSSPIYDDLESAKETTIYADRNVAYSTS